MYNLYKHSIISKSDDKFDNGVKDKNRKAPSEAT